MDLGAKTLAPGHRPTVGEGMEKEGHLKKRVIGAALVTAGCVILIPTALHFWKFIQSLRKPKRLFLLPESHTDFVLTLNGKPISDSTLVSISAVVGALCLLLGIWALQKWA